MTPRDAMIAALRGERPDALVPHVELEFQLTDELYGPEGQALRDGNLQDLTGAARQDKLKRNAEMWVDVAKRFKLNCNTILDGEAPDPQVYPGDQIEVKRRIF